MQTKKVHKAEKKLMDALLQFMVENVKIADISVSDLCEKAGVSRTAFYAYYDNVSNVQTAMEERAVEATIGQCATLFTEEIPTEQVKVLVAKNNAYISEHKEEILALMSVKLGSGFEERAILRIMDLLDPKFSAATYAPVRERVSAYALVEYTKYLIETNTYASEDVTNIIQHLFARIRAFVPATTV